MSTSTPMNDHTALPTYPGERDLRCPFDPPKEQADWLRAEGLQRVMWHGEPLWAVSRHEDIRAVLGDPRFSADFKRPGFPGATTADQNEPPIFPRMDDPEHARLRMMLTKDFTVKRVERMRPDVQKMADDFLDQMIAKGQPADLVHDYALPIPSLVISLLLGVPYSDHAFFQQHSLTLHETDATEQDKRAAKGALFGYLLELVRRKEREPGDDLISRLISERVATGELTHEAAAMNGIILLIAGHETTSNMIALGTLALLEHPDQAAKIRDTDAPAVVANAVEELLRYLTVPQDNVVRMALEDVTVGGQLVKAGEGLVINLPAGNRDTAFIDRPEVLDVDRNVRGHVAFAYGIHQCLGQSLARMELQVALPTLLRRLPGLRLAVPLEDLSFRHDMALYGVRELPVAW
ncbi:cytochrome P450 [Streptomyces sp. NPDC006355]|uniref:cytochrome P450 n=1 Tax=Streptomyces sp. NPDC006355 TaxID=3156758 RepID=UPI0033BBE473